MNAPDATSFLEGMIVRRRARISRDFGGLSPAHREQLACCSRAPRDFEAALCDRADVAVIAEVKKASPSAGPIARECEASKQALHYQDGGAAAISVLTEPESFGGSWSDLSDVADAVGVPVLCKDFVVDPVQLFVARGHGADAVLLMVSVLGAGVSEYVDIATTLGLTAVVEVASLPELNVALDCGTRIIAVNARDLHSLRVDAERQAEVIAETARAHVTVVAASGIKDRAGVQAASREGVDAVLVGEALMRSAFPEDVLSELTGVPKRAPA